MNSAPNINNIGKWQRRVIDILLANQGAHLLLITNDKNAGDVDICINDSEDNELTPVMLHIFQSLSERNILQFKNSDRPSINIHRHCYQLHPEVEKLYTPRRAAASFQTPIVSPQENIELL